MINLWTEEAVSVAQLMGEAPLDDLANDVDGLLAEAEELQAARDEKMIAADAGWDAMPPMPVEDA